MQRGRCRYYEWDEETFVIPDEFILDSDSELADAINVFFLAGGYNFFNVVDPEYYASNWIDFVGNLYWEITEGKYVSKNKHYAIPLTIEQKKELTERGIPEVFVTDLC